MVIQFTPPICDNGFIHGGTRKMTEEYCEQRTNQEIEDMVL